MHNLIAAIFALCLLCILGGGMLLFVGGIAMGSLTALTFGGMVTLIGMLGAFAIDSLV